MLRPFLVTALFSALCPAQNPHTTAADVAAGAKIFRSHCADCHGLTGKGGKGPDLTTGVFYHGGSDNALLENISNGIEGTAMPGQFFSPDQVWQVVSYVRSLAVQGSLKPPPGDAAAGAKLYASNGCANCHLVNGIGGVGGPELSYIGSQRPPAAIAKSITEPSADVDMSFWQADIVLEKGTAYKGRLLNEDTYFVQILTPANGLLTLPKRDFRKFQVLKTSSMPSFRSRLKPGELDDLVAYLWTLQRPRRAE